VRDLLWAVVVRIASGVVRDGFEESIQRCEGSRASVTEIWLPEVKSVETVANGRRVGISSIAISKRGRLTIARSQIKWREAADPRCQQIDRRPAIASTRKPLSNAST